MIGLAISLTKLSVSGQASDGADFNNETTALVAAMTSRPTEARIALINTLINSLKTAGVWAKLDVLWIPAAHDSQAGRLNWKSPGTFTLAEVSSPTFTADRGYAGNGTSSYLTTGWIPSTSGVNFVLNSASIIAWSRTAAQDASGIFGSGTTGNGRLIPRNATDFTAGTVNSATSTTRANTDGSGLFTYCRTASTVVQLYRNGSALGAVDAAVSTSVPGAQFNLLRNNSLFSSSQIAAAAAGASMDATENLALYNALQTYMTAIGA